MIALMKRALLMLLTWVTVAHAADVGISPARIDVLGRPGETVIATATILTTAATPQSITSSASDWTMNSAGDVAFLPAGSLAVSAAPWLELDVDDFVLAPGGSREARLAVTVPADTTAEGTHHAIVFFTVAPPPSETAGVGVATTTRIGLVVYVTVAGTEQRGSELIDIFESGGETITVVVLNTGNTLMRLGGTIELRDELGAVRHRLDVPNVAVLRDSERELHFDLPEGLESGFYVALALIEDSRGGLLAGELPFEVP